jgi:DNA invertase Pin-like site-specific DNA recombinase
VTAQTEALQATQQAPRRGGAYQRISKDKNGDEHGVANQLADQKRLAAACGIVITRSECDNDISASNGKRRDGYDALMAAAARGELDCILVYQTSRLWRNRRERAEGIEILRKAGVSVVATKGPSLDMSTAYGRAMAGLLGEFDTMETEVKGERQRLAAESAAAAGKRWTGCPRPFGYEDDHVTIRPAEAGAIRWAADALLGGGTVSAVAREWSRRGLTSVQTGRPFGRQSVTTILRNPRLAGLSAYRGEIVGIGQWEPVLTEEQWRAIAALLADPARKPPRGAYSLGGGLFTCQCGNTVQSSVNATGKHVYRCNPATRGNRAGPHCQQLIANVDAHVEHRIVSYIISHGVMDRIAPSAAVDTAALHREAAAIRRNLDEMAADRALGLITRTQMIAATERGNSRLAEIVADLAASAGGSALAPFAAAENAAEVWEGLDPARKRAVIGELTPVIIHPAGRGARTFSPHTVAMPEVRA